MSQDELAARYEVGAQVARDAGKVALDYFVGRDDLVIEHKGKQDLVSIADKNVELLIRDRIGAAFPGDSFLGEEGGGGESASLWIIDPIDGTANFLRGIPYWCVTFAYVKDGVTEVAFTYDAVHDELYAARRGGGATRNGEPITVSGRSDPAQSCLGLTYSFKQPIEPYAKLFVDATAIGLDHRRMGSSALSLCHVADGRLDALICLFCNSWDVVPGLLLVQEAGGVATIYNEDWSMTEPRPVAAATHGLGDAIVKLTGISVR